VRNELTDLLLAEYQTVRQEWLDARQAQQQALQWTLGAFAVIFAAALNAHLRGSEPFLYLLAAVVISLGTVASQFIWFGEVTRMERASLFLRGRERELHSALDAEAVKAVGIYGLSPWLWETWRANRPTDKKTPWVQKSVQAIAGPVLYGLTFLTGITMLVDARWFEPHTTPGERMVALLSLVVVLGLYGLTTIQVLWTGVSLARHSALGADLNLRPSPKETKITTTHAPETTIRDWFRH